MTADIPTMSSSSRASTHSTIITELNFEEANSTATMCTTGDQPEAQKDPQQNEDPQIHKDSELRSAIHAIMNDPATTAPTKTDSLRKSMGWTTGDASYGQLKTYEQFQESRSKAQYYNQALAVRNQPNPMKDRLLKTSVIIAEIKTNVIIQDEFTLLTTMSAFFAARYNRPESSVLVTLNHSACMLLGGSFEPAYFLTISAISEQIQPTMNRRNAAMIQQFLAEELLVTAERGIVKFHPLAEENIASGGVTFAAEILQEVKSSGPYTAAKEGQPGMSLSKRLLSRKRTSTRSTPPVTNLTEDSSMTVSPKSPARKSSPPSSGPGIGLELALPSNSHSRNISDATTSSDPDVDVLKGGVSRIKQRASTATTGTTLSTKKSSFLRKLVA